MLDRTRRSFKTSLLTIAATALFVGPVLAEPPAGAAAAPSTSAPATAPASSAAGSDSNATPPAAAAATSPPTPTPSAAAPAEPIATGAITAPATEPGPAPATAATELPVPAEAPAAAAASPQPPLIAESIKAALGDKATTAGATKDDIAAIEAFYAGRAEFLFAGESGWNDKGAAVVAEIKKADDYGLDASAFVLPDAPTGADVAARSAAEANLGLAALKYARFARGGRFDPQSTSNILDVRGEFKDPAAVMADLASSNTPDGVLRGLHPQHKQFEALRQALLKARGPAPAVETEIDPALKVKLPAGKKVKTLKSGVEDDDVALLRQRLKVPAGADGKERTYDDAVQIAVAAFQEANGLKATGVLNNSTRQALNREGEPKKAPDPDREVKQIIVNMERWRWLPADLGPVYVMNNIPEFMTRVVKGDQTLFEEKIIVGQTTWPTPMMTDSMERIVFNPSWGMPDGIKQKELLPRLRQASGGNDFFSQLFGGGGGGGRVIAAYGLKPTLDGRPVDPDSINWNNVDIRRYSFVQPPGASNPLGRVKFLFPNRHDVYMHDTPQRPLFAQSFRALSHGCIRVQNPEKLAEVLLSEDKGWDAEKVNDQYRSGGEILLDKPVPVYLTYFTARIDADGKLKSFSDIYGHDSRLLSALAGRPVRYEPPESSGSDVVADATVSDPLDQPAKKSSNKKSKSSKKTGDTPGDIISNALSGILLN